GTPLAVRFGDGGIADEGAAVQAGRGRPGHGGGGVARNGGDAGRRPQPGQHRHVAHAGAAIAEIALVVVTPAVDVGGPIRRARVEGTGGDLGQPLAAASTPLVSTATGTLEPAVVPSPSSP